MARFAIKALAVMALVCLVFDWSNAAEAQKYDNEPTNLDATKDKVNDMMKNLKKSASETFHSVKESENTKKVSNFFSDAFSKFKSVFSSPKTNQDDLKKQEAIKAFDEYAANYKKN